MGRPVSDFEPLPRDGNLSLKEIHHTESPPEETKVVFGWLID